MTKEEREVMQLSLYALSVLHDDNLEYLTLNKLGGKNNRGMVLAKETITALRAELNKPVQVIVAYQSESKPSDILSVEDYENIDPIWHWMYRPLYMPHKHNRR
jgi:hypothetical protein